MTENNSTSQDETEPIRETAQADEQKGEAQTKEPAPLPVVELDESRTQQEDPSESEEETDRKQDESIALLAQQTEWIKKQTDWMRRQVIASSFLGAVTLGVLIYHGVIMGKQSQAMSDQTALMKGQLEAMNSGTTQTQEMIGAMQTQATASQAVADQNRALVEQAGEQTKASLAQAQAAQSAARAAERGAQIAQQSFYIGDRPYMTAKNAVIDKFEAGVKPEIAVLFENTGKTPAIDLQVGAVVTVETLPIPNDEMIDRLTTAEAIAAEKQRLIYPFMPDGGTGLLAAGGLMPGIARGEELTPQIVAEIKEGKKYLMIFGGALYKDGLGKSHKLKFCMFYDPKKEHFTFCPTFNSTN